MVFFPVCPAKISFLYRWCSTLILQASLANIIEVCQ